MALAAFLAAVWVIEGGKKQSSSALLKIGGAELAIEVADSSAERTLGLSGRDSLGYNRGLLFIFKTEGLYSFWMKDMKFPIDIIWMDSRARVIEITSNVSPATFPESFTSQKSAKYVLEVNAGWASQNGIKIGDRAEF